MTKIHEKLEKKLRHFERVSVKNHSYREEKICVKIVANPDSKYHEVSEVVSKPGKPLKNGVVSSKSGIEMLGLELRQNGVEYFEFKGRERNKEDYLITELNFTQIRNIALRDYVDYIYDDSPIVFQKKDDEPKKEVEEIEEEGKIEGYHRQNGSEDL
ncbi:Uncharacterised protein [uncultured archaeon]|nr:Uncharacterised protein [uncultured archaeon]